MYLEHFGLTEKPFNITPNPQFIFLSKNHKEVFAHLLYGLESRCGFIEITGEVGAGKTTVLRTLFEELDDSEFRLAFIFNPSLSAEELLQEICREFGLDVADRRGGQLLTVLNRYLLEENAAGRTVVLVIDEAQNLAPPVLEQIRLLSNLETETDKLIQIILVGQPELAEVLSRNNLRQLNQRIGVRYHLLPMDNHDTKAYIRHRLGVAGSDGRALFSEPAIKLIFKQSNGLPRLINILCDRSLLAAYSEDRHHVSRDDVKTAIRELRHVASPFRKRSHFRPLYRFSVAAVLLTLAVVAGFHAYEIFLPRIERQQTSVAGVDVRTPVTAKPERLGKLRRDLATFDENDCFSRAATALAESWHAEFTSQLKPVFGRREFVSGLEENGWQWTSYSGGFESLTRLDTPALLEVVLPGVSGRRYLAVTDIENNMARISPALDGNPYISLAELEALFGGKAYFIWKNYLEIGYLSTVGTSESDVREIQSMLKTTVDQDLASSGVYDPQTIQAVTRFQAERGIVQDGRVGPLTLLLLYQQSGYFNPPRLSDKRST